MSITVDAVYEGGLLRPTQSLPLSEHEKVRLTVESSTSWAERTAGLVAWTGPLDVLRKVAEDDEFGIQESA